MIFSRIASLKPYSMLTCGCTLRVCVRFCLALQENLSLTTQNLTLGRESKMIFSRIASLKPYSMLTCECTLRVCVRFCLALRENLSLITQNLITILSTAGLPHTLCALRCRAPQSGMRNRAIFFNGWTASYASRIALSAPLMGWAWAGRPHVLRVGLSAPIGGASI